MIRRGGTCGTAACGTVRVEGNFKDKSNPKISNNTHQYNFCLGSTHVAMENVIITRCRNHAIDFASVGPGIYRNMTFVNNTGGTAFYSSTTVIISLSSHFILSFLFLSFSFSFFFFAEFSLWFASN